MSNTRRVGTCSFSAETISDISCSAPLIVIFCTASKHLRRWGCTADGSFVCERMLMSSSLLRK